MHQSIRYSPLYVFYAALLVLLLVSTGCKRGHEGLDLSMYQYRDTKDLVSFVYDAAVRLEKEGLKSLDYFRKNRDILKTDNYYLYIFDMDGTNIFHAGMRDLEGKNLSDMTDKDGKYITRLILEALADKNNPHAWVHYSWWEPGKFYPVPKSSSHFKVRTPEGRDFFVGAGMNYPHNEKEFIRIVVDGAVKLIREKGNKAFPEISDPLSQYNFRDVRVFVFRQDGEILISPVADSGFSQIRLLECVDEAGHKPFAKAMKELEKKDRVWQIFMAKHRDQRMLVKKILYLRKVDNAGREIYVGAITDLPHPP